MYNGSTMLLCLTIFVVHKQCLIRVHCSIVTVIYTFQAAVEQKLSNNTFHSLKLGGGLHYAEWLVNPKVIAKKRFRTITIKKWDFSKTLNNSIFGQFLPILTTFYEVKITFLKNSCSVVSKISNLFCARTFGLKSPSAWCGFHII
jgi:hypothetical protein